MWTYIVPYSKYGWLGIKRECPNSPVRARQISGKPSDRSGVQLQTIDLSNFVLMIACRMTNMAGLFIGTTDETYTMYEVN